MRTSYYYDRLPGDYPDSHLEDCTYDPLSRDKRVRPDLLLTLGGPKPPTHREILNGMVWEVESKFKTWGGKQVADLAKHTHLWEIRPHRCCLSAFENEEIEEYMDNYTESLAPWLEPEKATFFRNNVGAVTEYLVDLNTTTFLKFYSGENTYGDQDQALRGEGSIVFSYTRDGDYGPPTFLYLAYGLRPIVHAKQQPEPQAQPVVRETTENSTTKAKNRFKWGK